MKQCVSWALLVGLGGFAALGLSRVEVLVIGPSAAEWIGRAVAANPNRLRLRYMSALVHFSVLHVNPLRPVYGHSQFHTAFAARRDPPLSLNTCTAETSTPVHVVDSLDGWVDQVCRFGRPGSAAGLSIHVRCRR